MKAAKVALFPVFWFVLGIVVTSLPDVVNSMGTPTSIFGILRNRVVVACAINEQHMERFEKQNGGRTILSSFPSSSSSDEISGWSLCAMNVHE